MVHVVVFRCDPFVVCRSVFWGVVRVPLLVFIIATPVGFGQKVLYRVACYVDNCSPFSYHVSWSVLRFCQMFGMMGVSDINIAFRIEQTKRPMLKFNVQID